MTIINLGTRIVNIYLISSEVGWILIDTGYAGSFPHFMRTLGKNLEKCIVKGFGILSPSTLSI